jgi:hypothetical protein
MMVYLKFIFVNKQTSSLNKYEQIMEAKFLMKLNNSPKYIRVDFL